MARNARHLPLARGDTVCVCSGEVFGLDDAMVACELCDVWYHFMCINMTFCRAEELDLFVCSSCEEKTGVHSIRLWEGIDTATYVQNALNRRANTLMKPRQLDGSKNTTDSDLESDESESGFSQMSDEKYDSDSNGSFAGSDLDGVMTRPNPPSDSPYRTVKASGGLAPKRKTIALSRPSKRPKTNRPKDVLVDTTDPARSYCLAQLEAVLRPIFTEHSLQAPLEIASQYAKQVENHLFGQFAEPDRSGAMAVGHKYKTQFRMLSFNLEKPDRQSLRRKIGQGELPASELSGMSNADLASEQQKKEMENAHQESLQHSILDAYGIDRPLRKITHKGEEEIEDLSKEDKDSSTWSSRTADPSSHDGVRRVAASSSVELDARDTSLGLLSERSAADSPIIDNATELYMRPRPLSLPDAVGADLKSDDPSPSGDISSPSTSTMPFNVNAIAWSPKIHEIDLPGVDSGGSPLMRSIDEGDIGSDEHSVDHDFNELLELDRPVQRLIEIEPATKPNPIWKGELCMPSALGRQTIVNVHSHLIAGRPATFEDPAFWANLFRTDSLTIEGRVPIPASESYLLNSRLNSGRELVAVSFTPLERADRQNYEEICDGLLAKGRHAVVLPWGNPPCADAPGKELYLVPLQPSDRPGYLDMLEHLSLPVARSEILLVGIFILHRARRISYTPPFQPIPPYPMTSGPPSLQSPPIQSPSSLGFDISVLTPEFIADILKNNPGIGATASAAFPDASMMDAHPPSVSPYLPNGPAPQPPSAQVDSGSAAYRGSNWSRDGATRQHQTGSYDRTNLGRAGTNRGRVGQRGHVFDRR